MADNPFKKKPEADHKPRPGSPKPPPPQKKPSPGPEASDDVEISDDVKDLCPFLGTSPMIIPPKKGQILTGGQPVGPTMEPVMMPCVYERCAMWDKDADDCGVRLGYQAMASIAGPLEQLAKKFGA